MTQVRTVAAHDVVGATYPREVTEKDELGMAVGRAIDETLSQFSHESGQGRRPTITSMQRFAAEVLDRELEDADLALSAADLQHERDAILGVLQAFRKSEVMGLSRPKSRLILLNERVGVYAQPDYWNGRDRFYEMKSYLAHPTPPDVTLQLRLFQCAFPGFQGMLASFDRHVVPATTTIEAVPVLSAELQLEVLTLAYQVGLAKGTDKVLEYIDHPVVRYTIPVPGVTAPT